MKRRFEILCKNGPIIVDDYAHHPVEIGATLAAARKGWPDRRIVAVMQPHRFSRLSDHYEEFIDVLKDADAAVIMDVYSAGEKPIKSYQEETMERRLQEVSEENDSVRADDGRGPGDAIPMVQEGGLDTLSGSGECDADSEVFCEELDLASFSPRLRARFERQSEEEMRLSREKREELENLLPPGSVVFDCDMSAQVSIAASGIAEALVSVCDAAALKDVIRWAVESDVEYSFIGSCSKTIVRENGVSGLLIRLGEQFDSVELVSESENEVLILAGAAASVRKLIGLCVEKGLSGLEDLLLYEGTIGGCVSSDVSLSNGDKISKSVVETTIITRNRGS